MEERLFLQVFDLSRRCVPPFGSNFFFPQEEVHDYVVKLRKAERSAAQEPVTRAPAGSLSEDHAPARHAPREKRTI